MQDIQTDVQTWVKLNTPGFTKPGKLGRILILYQLKSPSLDSKVKLKSPFFFLQVGPFLLLEVSLSCLHFSLMLSEREVKSPYFLKCGSVVCPR